MANGVPSKLFFVEGGGRGGRGFLTRGVANGCVAIGKVGDQVRHSQDCQENQTDPALVHHIGLAVDEEVGPVRPNQGVDRTAGANSTRVSIRECRVEQHGKQLLFPAPM